jgi:hypothetical protein
MSNEEFMKAFNKLSLPTDLENLRELVDMKCPLCDNRSNTIKFIGPVCVSCWEKKVNEIKSRTCEDCHFDCAIKNVSGVCLSWRKKK